MKACCQKTLVVWLGMALMASATAIRAFGGISDARREECRKRAEELVSRMTSEECAEQMQMHSPALPRLGIPAYSWWNEALHGVARAGVATVFPQSMGLAATFDADVVERVASAVSTEGRAKYNLFAARNRRGIYQGLTYWSPNVNMLRDPRWGRGQETFGEDPYLTGRIGAAFVRGIQGDDPNYLKAAACAKHFAVHSGPEKLRHGFDAKISERDLREYYLQAFKTLAVDARVEAFMGAYSAINGIPCCENARLITEILRGEWGFRGHVVSDVGAIYDIFSGHHRAKNITDASRRAMTAGLDLNSEENGSFLRNAVRSGCITEGEIRTHLVRLFTTRYLLGQFDPPGSTPWDGLGENDIATVSHRALALEAAEKSIVLLSNNGALPVDGRETRGFFITGNLSTDEMGLFGNYNGLSRDAVSCVTGFVREVPPDCVVSSDPSSDCDVTIVCLGITARDEGEDGSGGGDRNRYGLPVHQITELEKLQSRRRNGKLIGVVFGCTPFDLEPIVKLCDAVLLVWYPGEQGGCAISASSA